MLPNYCDLRVTQYSLIIAWWVVVGSLAVSFWFKASKKCSFIAVVGRRRSEALVNAVTIIFTA